MFQTLDKFQGEGDGEGHFHVEIHSTFLLRVAAGQLMDEVKGLHRELQGRVILYLARGISQGLPFGAYWVTDHNM